MNPYAETITLSADQQTVLSEKGYATVQDFVNDQFAGGVNEIVQARDVAIAADVQADPNAQTDLENDENIAPTTFTAEPVSPADPMPAQQEEIATP